MAYFEEKTVDDVWKKAKIVNTEQADVWRKDYAGAWIKKSEYGNCESQYGWEIDHQKPVSKGGTDDIFNLVPLQWENNRSKCDDYPKWKTSVSADGTINTYQTKSWEV